MGGREERGHVSGVSPDDGSVDQGPLFNPTRQPDRRRLHGGRPLTMPGLGQ